MLLPFALLFLNRPFFGGTKQKKYSESISNEIKRPSYNFVVYVGNSRNRILNILFAVTLLHRRQKYFKIIFEHKLMQKLAKQFKNKDLSFLASTKN